MEPLAGAAPARFSYKANLQAAAKRQKNWWAATVLPRVLRFKRPLHHSLMLAARQSEGWSQSRVLPSAELAYETRLSAGPIAKWSPHPELHRVGSRTERAHHWKCFGGFENGRRETSGLPKPSKMGAPSRLARYREQECSSKAA